MPFGATILDADGFRLTSAEKAFFREADPFGFILFSRNIDTPDQVRTLCDELRETVGREAVITVDQEGGRVQRLRGPHWTDWTPPLDFIEAAGGDPAHAAAEAMYLRYHIIGQELRAVGIDSNCAPTLDVAGPETHPFLRNRCYGEDPETVARLGRAAADGMLEAGVLPVIKHMPGHGRATLDSHLHLPTVNADIEALEQRDFAPFKALRDLPMGMTAHLVYEVIDDTPATLSPRLMRLIREDIGFDNLIMTDDISMKALRGAPGQIARDALDAGCDVALYCNASLEDRHAVADAAGRMTPAAQVRAERALAARTSPADVDIPALKAKLAALTGGAAAHG